MNCSVLKVQSSSLHMILVHIFLFSKTQFVPTLIFEKMTEVLVILLYSRQSAWTLSESGGVGVDMWCDWWRY